MATVATTVFLPELAPHLSGCPEPVILNALVTAATEFCTRSLVWQERNASVNVTSASFPYTITVPAHGTLDKVLVVEVDTAILGPTSWEQLDHNSGWDDDTGSPYKFLIDPHGRLVVYPLPNKSMPLRLTIAVTALRSATVLEDFLHTRWRDTLVAGALRLLHAIPDKPWSKPDMVEYHTRKFEQGVTAARVEAGRSQLVSNQSVAMRPF